MKKFWAVMAILGLFVAICTADDSNHELLLRLVGAAMLIFGAWFGGFMDIGNNNDDGGQGQ